jgi:DNA-binding transcriptional LysR family regulator
LQKTFANSQTKGEPVAEAFLPSWDQVRLFLALMRARTLTEAGKRVRLDASNVSRRLVRLEGEMGVSLFDRTRDGLVPTSAAENLLAYAEEVELGIARFAAASAQGETRVEGVVRLTAPPGVADTFVAPLLPELFARYPRLTIELDASVGYSDLTRREADLALRTVRPVSGDLIVAPVVATRELPMASEAYAQEVGRLCRFEDARWVAFGDELAHLPGPRWLRKHAPAVVPVLRSNHFSSLLAATRSGLGVAVLPEPYALTGLVPIARAKRLAAAWAGLPSTNLWIVAHRALRRVPRVAAVWDFLLAKLGAFPARRVGLPLDDAHAAPSRGGGKPPPRTRARSTRGAGKKSAAYAGAGPRRPPRRSR